MLEPVDPVYWMPASSLAALYAYALMPALLRRNHTPKRLPIGLDGPC
jgi:hypothetical protein